MRLPAKLVALIQTFFHGWHRGWWIMSKSRLVPVPVRRLRAIRRHIRRGLTLVEMMVSVTLSLLVVFALVEVFDLIGNNVTDSRAIIEMSGNLRSAASLLRRDLEGVTVTTVPPRNPESNEGYLEIVEGPTTDRQNYIVRNNGVVANNLTATYVDLAHDPDNPLDPTLGEPFFRDTNEDGFVDRGPVPLDTSVGDVDDILAFTTRSDAEPFVGVISHPGVRFANGLPAIGTGSTATLESDTAEVMWWLQIERNIETDIQTIAGLSEADQIRNAVSDIEVRESVVQRYPSVTPFILGTPVRSLHRRALLIRPDLDLSAIELVGLGQVASFVSNNDISVRIIRISEGRYGVAANTLGDLTRRRNRFCRFSFPSTAPWQLKRTRISARRDARQQLLSEDSLVLRHAAMKDMVLHESTPHATFMIRRGQGCGTQ